MPGRTIMNMFTKMFSTQTMNMVALKTCEVVGEAFQYMFMYQKMKGK